MRARLILIVAAGVVLSTLALAPPAQAGHLDWSFGVGFHVGGLHFRVGFEPTGWGGYPGPFFLTTSRLHYPGYGCNGACFRRGAGYYHHASCPLLGFHFRRGGFGADYYVHNYSPYRSFGRGYGYRTYRPYGYYNRGYGHYQRDRFRSRPGHRYRDHRYRDHRYRDHRYRGDRHRGDQRHRGSGDHRGRGRDYDHDSDSERGQRYRNDRGPRGRGGGRDYAQPRGRAQRTRPPR